MSHSYAPAVALNDTQVKVFQMTDRIRTALTAFRDHPGLMDLSQFTRNIASEVRETLPILDQRPPGTQFHIPRLFKEMTKALKIWAADNYKTPIDPSTLLSSERLVWDTGRQTPPPGEFQGLSNPWWLATPPLGSTAKMSSTEALISEPSTSAASHQSVPPGPVPPHDARVSEAKVLGSQKTKSRAKGKQIAGTKDSLEVKTSLPRTTAQRPKRGRSPSDTGSERPTSTGSDITGLSTVPSMSSGARRSERLTSKRQRYTSGVGISGWESDSGPSQVVFMDAIAKTTQALDEVRSEFEDQLNKFKDRLKQMEDRLDMEHTQTRAGQGSAPGPSTGSLPQIDIRDADQEMESEDAGVSPLADKLGDLEIPESGPSEGI